MPELAEILRCSELGLRNVYTASLAFSLSSLNINCKNKKNIAVNFLNPYKYSSMGSFVPLLSTVKAMFFNLLYLTAHLNLQLNLTLKVKYAYQKKSKKKKKKILLFMIYKLYVRSAPGRPHSFNLFGGAFPGFSWPNFGAAVFFLLLAWKELHAKFQIFKKPGSIFNGF